VNWIRAAFFAVLAACAIAITIDVHRLMPKAAAALDSVQSIETNTTRTEAEMTGLLNTVRHVAMDYHAAETKQLANMEALSSRAETLLIDADRTMKHLDASALQLQVIGSTTNEAVAKIAFDTHGTLIATQETLQAATADLSDPTLKQSLARIGEASANLAEATKQAAGAAADVHKVTTYEARQIMAPVSKAKAIALITVRLVGKVFWFLNSTYEKEQQNGNTNITGGRGSDSAKNITTEAHWQLPGKNHEGFREGRRAGRAAGGESA
jgi:hypothetical protein